MKLARSEQRAGSVGREGHTGVGGAASVSNEAINLAKVLDNVVHELSDVVVVANIELVGLNLDAVGGSQLLGVLLAALRARGVGDGDVGTHLSTSTSSLDAHATGPGGAGDDHDLALQAEEVLEGVGLGDWDRHDERLGLGLGLGLKLRGDGSEIERRQL